MHRYVYTASPLVYRGSGLRTPLHRRRACKLGGANNTRTFTRRNWPKRYHIIPTWLPLAPRNGWCLRQAPFRPFGPPNRQQIDGNVRAFQPLDLQTVVVLGTEGNLWLEQAPFGKVPRARTQIDGNVAAVAAVTPAGV
jgi:hypothetical protein